MNCFTAVQQFCLSVLAVALLGLPASAQQPLLEDPFQPRAQNNQPAAANPQKENGKPANAKEGNGDAESKRDKLLAELDEIELQIAQEKKAVEYALGAVGQYSEELTQEYLQNKDVLESSDVEGKTQAELQRRQKRISLHLWELKRIEPELARNVPYTPNSARSRLTKLFSGNRELFRERDVMTRVSKLMSESRQTSPFGKQASNTEFYFIEPTGSENETKPSAEVDTDPLGPQLHAPLQRLLRIKDRDGQLVLDRSHWEEAFGGISLAEVAKDVQRELMQYGLKMDTGTNQRFPTQSRPPAILVFENLQHVVADKAGRRSSGSTNNQWRCSCSGSSVDAQLNYGKFLFDFSLQGRSARGNLLRVLCDDTIALKVTGITDDRIFVVTQKRTGEFHYVDIIGEETLSLTADSFGKFYAENTSVVEKRMFPFLTELGFTLPPKQN